MRDILYVLGTIAFAAPRATADTPTPTPPPAGSPMAEVLQLLSDLNAGDNAAVYAQLAPKVQQEFSLEELTEALQNVSEGAGPLQISIVSVNSIAENGDLAEIASHDGGFTGRRRRAQCGRCRRRARHHR